MLKLLIKGNRRRGKVEGQGRRRGRGGEEKRKEGKKEKKEKKGKKTHKGCGPNIKYFHLLQLILKD